MKSKPHDQPELFPMEHDARPATERSTADRYREPSLLDAIREAPPKPITPPAEFSYNRWIDEQHEIVRDALDRLAKKQGYRSDLAIFALPSVGPVPGKLIVADEAPPPAECLWFPAQGTAAMAVPRSHLRGILWTACRSMPICPT